MLCDFSAIEFCVLHFFPKLRVFIYTFFGISLSLVSAAAAENQPDVNVVLSAYSQQGDPALYEVYYSGLKRFIETVLDCHRAELSQVFYPLFVHMYLELVYNNHENESKAFFEK